MCRGDACCGDACCGGPNARIANKHLPPLPPTLDRDAVVYSATCAALPCGSGAPSGGGTNGSAGPSSGGGGGSGAANGVGGGGEEDGGDGGGAVATPPAAVVLKVYQKGSISAAKHRAVRREARIMRFVTEAG